MKRLVGAIATAAACAACSFPDHQFQVEDCFNGIDDDGNGLVDCSDPACTAQTVCMPNVPEGWQGPVALWHGGGSDSPPGCSNSGFPGSTFQQLFDGPITGSEKCPTCSCASSTAAQVPACFARVQAADVDSCVAPNRLMVGPDGDAGFVVGDTCTKVVLDFTQFIPGSFFFYAPYVVSDACAAQSTGQAVIPAATFDNSLRACDLSGLNPAGCRGPQQRCVPRPQSGFSPTLCIYQDANDASCPEPFSNQKFVYSLYTDNRYCTDCACTASNLACTGDGADISVAYYDNDSTCSTPAYVIPQSPGCKTRDTNSTASTVYMTLQNAKPAATATPNCQVNGGLLVGSVSPSQTVTFCCWNY